MCLFLPALPIFILPAFSPSLSLSLSFPLRSRLSRCSANAPRISRDFTTSREKFRFSICRMLPMPHNSPSSYPRPTPFAVSFDYRRETRRAISRNAATPCFLIAAPSKRMWQSRASSRGVRLANNRSSLRYRHPSISPARPI